MAVKQKSALEAAEAESAPKKSKLSKKLVAYFIIGFVAVLVAVAFINGGSDLGQGEENKKREENLKSLKDKAYEDAVPDPAAAAEAAAEKALAEAKKTELKPVPGAPLPVGGLPTSAAEMSQAEIDRYETARRAIEQGRLPNASTKGRGPGAAGGDNSDTPSNANVDTSPRASFLSASTQSTRSLPTAPPSPTALAQPSLPTATDAASAARPADPRAAGRESAMQLMEMQAKMAREMQAAQAGKPTTGALPVDGNSSWLYAAQSREPTENKPLQAQVTMGRYVIFAGTAIQAVLTQALDTKLPGQVTARVTRDIYDSRYGRFLVVPRGSVLTGSYRSAVTDGQSRVLMAFDRLITPAGGSVPLGNMSASDALGVGGVPGELHTHFFQRLGIATLLAIETAVMEKHVGSVGTVQGNSTTGQSGQATASASGQIMLQTANQELQRQYAVTPHITLEPAAVITIISTADIEIGPLANTR